MTRHRRLIPAIAAAVVAGVILIGPDGRLVDLFNPATAAEAVAARIGAALPAYNHTRRGASS